MTYLRLHEDIQIPRTSTSWLGFCDMTHSEFFTCVTWLIHTYDMTYLRLHGDIMIPCTNRLWRSVSGLGFRFERLGFRVQGLWFRQEEISHSSSWPDMPGLDDGFTIVRFSLRVRLWVHLYTHLLIVRISSLFAVWWGLARVDSYIASLFFLFWRSYIICNERISLLIAV